MAATEHRPPVTPVDALSAFGLAVATGAPPKRSVVWERLERRAMPRRNGSGAVLVDRRFGDGRPMLRIEHAPDSGYLIWAPGYGRHVVAEDGLAIRSVTPSSWHWQRLFYAQVLPLAATLQGLDLFHASAVAVGGRVLAFVAASGTGKTSVAAHLVARGATFVTDDVLALEATRHGVLCHPGPPMLGVEPGEVERMSADGRARLGAEVGRTDKVHFATPPQRDPLPLAHVYFLHRGPEIRELAIEEQAAPEARPLLAASFLAYLRTPARLSTHLDTCARVASGARMFDASLPPEGLAVGAAAALEEHALSLLDGR